MIQKFYKYFDLKNERKNGVQLWQGLTQSRIDSKNPEAGMQSKHFVVKNFKTKNPEEASDFITDGILDSYLSRIMHGIDTSAPKGKFIKPTTPAPEDEFKMRFGSRLYPLDHVEGMLPGILESYNLRDALSDRGASTLIGLLPSLVFRIVIDDWDTKLLNFSAYPIDDKGTNLTFPFDYEYALGNIAGCEKSWQQYEVESLVLGTKMLREGSAEGSKIGVGRALSETIAEFGVRTNDFYYNHPSSIDIRADYTSHNIIINNLNEQLTAINPDHSLALLAAFKEMFTAIKMAEPKAFDTTIHDTSGKLEPLISTNEIINHCKKLRGKLKKDLSKFEGFVDAIEAKILLERSVQSRVASHDVNLGLGDLVLSPPAGTEVQNAVVGAYTAREVARRGSTLSTYVGGAQITPFDYSSLAPPATSHPEAAARPDSPNIINARRDKGSGSISLPGMVRG